MKNKTKLFALFIMLFFCHPGFSQVGIDKTAQSTMNFLLVGTSSKASSMGEAFTSFGKGAESMFFNPSGLSAIDGTFEINLNYTRWIADIDYLSGAIAYNLNSLGVVGLNLLTVNYGTINGTSLVPSGQQNAYPLGFIDNGPVNNVSAYAVGLTYAKSISQEFSIGGSLKLAGQNLGVNNFTNGISKENNASKLVFDAGIRYLTGFRSFAFGMYIRNFSSNIKRELVDEQLPLVFALGASMNILEVIKLDDLTENNKVNFAIDFLHQNNYSERINLGLEYEFMHLISLRGGYQTNRDLASWSGGVGLNTSFSGYDLEVNYSYSRFEIFSSVNRISLIFTL